MGVQVLICTRECWRIICVYMYNHVYIVHVGWAIGKFTCIHAPVYQVWLYFAYV